MRKLFCLHKWWVIRVDIAPPKLVDRMFIGFECKKCGLYKTSEYPLSNALAREAKQIAKLFESPTKKRNGKEK